MKTEPSPFNSTKKAFKKMNMLLLIKCIFLFFLLMASCSGCATSKLRHVEANPSHQYAFHQEIEGLTIAVDPYFESNRNEEVFGLNLIQKKVVPIFLVVENHCQKTYLIEKNEILLYCSDSSSDKKSDVVENKVIVESARDTEKVWRGVASGVVAVNTAGSVASFATGTLVMVPLPIQVLTLSMLISKMNESQNIIQNIIKNEFPDQTLAPSETIYGFLYFKLNHDMASNCNKPVLHMKVKNLSNNEVSEIAFNLPQIQIEKNEVK